MILLLLLSLICIIILLVEHLHTSASKRQQIEHSGCQLVPKIPLRDKLGIRKLRDHVQARKEHRFPSFLIETLDNVGENIHTASHQAVNHEMFYTRDMENIKAILNAPQADFALGCARGANFAPVLGGGLFTAEGQAWQHYRASARPLFTHAQQRSNMKAIEWLLRKTWASLSVDFDGWSEEVDLQTLFLDLMLDATVDLLLGDSRQPNNPTDKHTEGPDKPNATTFVASLDAATTYVGNRTIWGKLYWVRQSQEFQHHCQTIRDFIDFRFSTFKGGASSQRLGGDVAKTDYTSSQWQNLTELRNLVQPFLSTGRNGTGALIAVIFFYLMKNPSIHDMLRRAVISTFGREGIIEFSELDSCEYLHFCILESLRLGSIVPAIIRSAKRDIVLPRGGGSDRQSPIFLPKGSSIIICIHAVHLRTDLWGEDAASFNPDRWRSYRFDWSFLPFGKGRRQCIGRESSIL